MPTLLQQDRFQSELGSLPKSVRKKVVAHYETLRTSPSSHSSCKRLRGYKDLWRLRLGDYRLVYRLDAHEDAVYLLMVGRRSDIYDRLHVDGADSGPPIEIVADRPDLLEPEPSPTQIGHATMQVAARPDVQHTPETLLPQPLTVSWLAEHHVPEAFHAKLLGVRTEEDLLSVEGLPGDWHERVMDLALGSPIEQALERPMVVTPDTGEENTSERSLASFLLRLDADQEAFLDAYRAADDGGPWLVKGGPGSGKTVVAAYAIRDIVERSRKEGRAARILFTTFTRALATAASQLLLHLGVDPEDDGIHVENIDALARRLSPGRQSVITQSSNKFPEALRAAVRACVSSDYDFPWSIQDEGFLMDEIEWVITGRGITTRDAYLRADRTGRSRPLDEAERRHLWSFYLAFRHEIQQLKRRTFEDVLAEALQHAEAQYTHVIVDEVQDLKPIAVELCAALCEDPRRVILTLDPNQSIYGAHRAWAATLPASMAAPRSVVLRRNHRSTSELWEAQQQILGELEVHDPETLAGQGQRSGEIPRLVATRKEDEAETIAAFLHDSLIRERASLGCAAILCPTNWDCHSVAKALPTRLRARVMESKDLDLDHDGVKVMTMHAAKGLQFPVVVVARMDRGRFPSKPAPGIDAEVHEQQSRRLLFVACSRAMRRLMVIHTAGKPSPLLEGLDDGAWFVEP